MRAPAVLARAAIVALARSSLARARDARATLERAPPPPPPPPPRPPTARRRRRASTTTRCSRAVDAETRCRRSRRRWKGSATRGFRVALARRTAPVVSDEACREFIRIPGALPNGADPTKLVKNLCANYDADELRFSATARVPLGAQIMGSEPWLLELAARHLATEKSAPRIDLNCGCPANVVTGKGAGSSLLRDPEYVYACVKAVADGARGSGAHVTMKLRSGYDDSSLLRENLLAAREAGARFVSLHARTRAQGYSGRANWEEIAFAKDVLDIPVLGNGDVTSPQRAAELLRGERRGRHHARSRGRCKIH